MSNESECDACGKRPEVYGSPWCAHCHDSIPEVAKRRIIVLRNALLDISTTFNGHPGHAVEAANRAVGIADKALDEFPMRKTP